VLDNVPMYMKKVQMGDLIEFKKGDVEQLVVPVELMAGIPQED